AFRRPALREPRAPPPTCPRAPARVSSLGPAPGRRQARPSRQVPVQGPVRVWTAARPEAAERARLAPRRQAEPVPREPSFGPIWAFRRPALREPRAPPPTCPRAPARVSSLGPAPGRRQARPSRQVPVQGPVRVWTAARPEAAERARLAPRRQAEPVPREPSFG